MSMNFGDILDAIAPVLPADAPAFIHGERIVTWPEADRLSNNLARGMLKRGAQTGDKVAFYMRNCPEYMLTLAACFKARLTHVNVNYRYTPDEVWCIFDNSDATVVVYGEEFRDAIQQIKDRLPKVKAWIEVTAGAPAPFAETFDKVANEGDGKPLGIERSVDDMLFIYTGGTTGMPKGVMWTHGDMREISDAAARKLGPVPSTPAELAERIKQTGPGPRVLPAPPLMHGTGLLTAFFAMLSGGCVITLTHPSFNPEELLMAIDKHKPRSMSIVGDSFAKPMLNAMNANPGKYDLSSMFAITSSGVMWSQEVKQGLLEHMPQAVLSDGFSSSEAIGMGSSITTKAGVAPTAKFTIGERAKVIDENDNFIEPGSETPGLLALGPPNPLGYYKDDEKTARTFRTIQGVRYSIPGDYCLVGKDGTITLLGRGNACINTAGEKVFPEEVEEALKTHESIEDALVIGVPDEKWGQSITGVVVLADGATLNEEALRQHVRAKLAGYKTPKRVILADASLRASNGKADYKAAREAAERALGFS